MKKIAGKSITASIIVLLISISLTMVAGCSKDKKSGQADDAKKQTTGKKAGEDGKTPGVGGIPLVPGGTPEPEKPETVENVYIYSKNRPDGTIKRDPFSPIVVGGITPAEQFDISQLGVNGVIMHGTKTANVKTPNGDSVMIRVGDRIGINGGVVTEISFEGITVREQYIDAKGRIQEYERQIENKPFSASKK